MRSFAGGGLVALLLTGTASAPALAAWFTCVPLRTGETAAAAATRVAGVTGGERQPWFQLFDPAASRFVDKTAYGRLGPGWHACLADAQGGRALATPHARPAALHVRPAASLDVIDRLASMPEVWAGLALLLSGLVAWELAEHSPAMRARARELSAFGERFAREFERPLLRPVPGDRAIESRVRVSPHARRLDVLLRPAGGRHYPNLADHRTNVEYDIGRVLHTLHDDRFTPRRLSAEGRWVKVQLVGGQ